ncbi:MAG: peptidoglycan DD-metalloendopeptidase family protein [Patescibacteria group bacterium]
MKNRKILNSITIFTICAIFLMAQNSFLTLALEEQTTTEEEKEEIIDDKQDELKKLEKKEKKYNDIINLKQKEQAVINAQIKKIEGETYQIEKTIETNEEDLKKLESDIERVKKEISQKEDNISLQKKVLEKFIIEKYQDHSKNSELFAVLNIANKNKLVHGDNISHTTAKVGDFVKKIHTQQQKLEKDKEKFEEKSKKIKDAKYELEQRSEHLKSSKDYKRVLASQVGVEEDKYQEKLTEVKKKQLAIQQEISALSTSQIGTFSLADLPSKSKADFAYPVKDPFVVSQGYGKTSFSSHYKGGLHNGVDYVAKGSQSIIAVAKGKIKATGNMGRYGYGKWVAIDHDNGLITLYGHLSSVSVSKGEKVKQGDKLGKMGNTGYSTGPHLHFSVFAGSTFAVIESSSVSGVDMPTGATVNPGMYL